MIDAKKVTALVKMKLSLILLREASKMMKYNDLLQDYERLRKTATKEEYNELLKRIQ